MPHSTIRTPRALATIYVVALLLNGCASTQSSGSATSGSGTSTQGAAEADRQMVAQTIANQQQQSLTTEQLPKAALCKPMENGTPMPRPAYHVTNNLTLTTSTENDALFCEAQPPEGEVLRFVAREWEINDAVTAVNTTPEMTESLVIQGNSGRYLSPYTSDGVVAEWVNKAVNNQIGSTTGSAVGGVVGAAAANKALENVPGASVIGGFLGSKAGETVGNNVADNTSGGDAYRRQTSDISFNSLNDMAAWLAATHGNKANFSEVIEATNAVYPSLMEAMRKL